MGRLDRPKASRRAVGVSGRMERAEVNLSRSDIVLCVGAGESEFELCSSRRFTLSLLMCLVCVRCFHGVRLCVVVRERHV